MYIHTTISVASMFGGLQFGGGGYNGAVNTVESKAEAGCVTLPSTFYFCKEPHFVRIDIGPVQ